MGDPHDVLLPAAYASVGRHRLHYRCEGEGAPVVVFDAGIAASSLSWSRVQPAVARVTRACSYDRAGLAWSDLATTPRSMPTLVSELRELLHQAGLPPPYVLVGHSFGALVLRAFARTHRRDVAGLVLVDPLHPEEWSAPTREQRHMLRGGIFLSRVGAGLAQSGLVGFLLRRLSGGSLALPRRASRLFGSAAATVLTNMVTEVQKLPPEAVPAIQEHWSNAKAFRGMRQHLAALPECSAGMLRGVDEFGDMPIVVLAGERRDPRWTAADALLARASTRGRHIVVPGSGHWVHFDDPDLVVNVIRNLVVQVRREHGSG
jgi:pimeloyl-ACP methyl ester carboxylesterase